jgi:lysozyme family protein
MATSDPKRQPITEILERYARQRRSRYRSLGHFWRFGRGWLARVDATLNAATRLASQPPTSGVPAVPDTTTKPNLPAPAPSAAQPTKWWGHSITIWGTLITALTTVLPLLGPALGLDIKPELVRQLGDNLVAVAQAVTGLAGTLMALYGRAIAVAQLERRNVTLQI